MKSFFFQILNIFKFRRGKLRYYIPPFVKSCSGIQQCPSPPSSLLNAAKACIWAICICASVGSVRKSEKDGKFPAFEKNKKQKFSNSPNQSGIHLKMSKKLDPNLSKSPQIVKVRSALRPPRSAAGSGCSCCHTHLQPNCCRVCFRQDPSKSRGPNSRTFQGHLKSSTSIGG